MKASDFIQRFKTITTWEAAAYDLAASGENIQPEFTMVSLSMDGHAGQVAVANDYFMVGEPGDVLRLPMLPGTAQKIANLKGYLLPTPMLEWRIWQQSQKVKFSAIGNLTKEPNKGAVMSQYLAHSKYCDTVIADVGGGLVSGHKKDIVVGNIYKPRVVLIEGVRRTDQPDVFDDHTKMENPTRQPLQPYSNAHGDFYVDYSHGARFVMPICTVDGQQTETIKLYTDPVLSKMVSHEGPVKTPRYPAPMPAGGAPGGGIASGPSGSGNAGVGTIVASNFVPKTQGGFSDVGTDVMIAQARTKLGL